MDYDKTDIARSYDRARTMDPARVKVWLDRFVVHAPRADVHDIVDLGCGTGRFSQVLADLYGARLTGVDPSETMLAQARAKSPALTFLMGAGESVPLGDASADLVFLSLVYHHLKDRAATARECWRVLRPGGFVMIRTPTIDAHGYEAFVRFFPTYGMLAQETLPVRADLRETHRAAGFIEAAHETIAHPTSESWDDFAAKASLRADSFLARLADEEFKEGLQRLRAFLDSGAGPIDPLTEDIDLFVFRKPG